MKYKEYYIEDVSSELYKIKEKIKPSIGFYQSVEFAYTIEVLQIGKPIYFVNENSSIFILGYANSDKHLFIIRPEYIQYLFDLIDEVKSYYDEITIITDERVIIKRYINEVKKTGYFVTPVIKLDEGIDQVIKNFSSGRRETLKKAKREPFSITSELSDSNIVEFAKLYSSTLEEGKSKEEQYSAQQFEKLLRLNCYKLYLCKYQGIIAAGVILIDYGNTVEERYLATNSSLRYLNGSTFLKEYCLNLYAGMDSVKYYDLGGYTYMQKEGSKLSGINFFKKSFGGKLKKYYDFSL